MDQGLAGQVGDSQQVRKKADCFNLTPGLAPEAPRITQNEGKRLGRAFDWLTDPLTLT